PVTWRCLHRHAAAQRAQVTLDETQSQSRAAGRRNHTLSAIERFEDMRQILRRDSRPAVSNSDLHFPALPGLRGTGGYTQPLASRCVLQRIVKQILQGTFQRGTISEHQRQIFCKVLLDLPAIFRERHSVLGQRAFGYLSHVGRLWVINSTTRLYTRKAKDSLDLIDQPSRFTLNHVTVLLHPPRILDRALR